MFTRGVTRVPAVREMDRANRVASLATNKIAWRQCFQSGRPRRKFVQQPVNHAAQDTLRKTFRSRVDRRDSAKMDRYLLVILNDLKLRVLHANSVSAQPRLTKDHHTLAGGDHFLYVMQIEPSAHERLAQSVWVRFLQRGLENFLPTAEATQRRLDHLPAKTDRNITLFARKPRKFRSVFMAPRKVRKQIFHRFDAQPP